MDQLENNKLLVQRYHAATNSHALDELDTIFSPNFINFAAGFPPIQGRDAMKSLIQELLSAFPDWHVTVEDIFGEGDKVVVRWKLLATHTHDYKDIPATGKKIQAEGIHIDQIENELVIRRWASNNFSAVFAELRKA